MFNLSLLFEEKYKWLINSDLFDKINDENGENDENEIEIP